MTRLWVADVQARLMAGNGNSDSNGSNGDGR